MFSIHPNSKTTTPQTHNNKKNNNRPKWLLLKTSSYLSLGHSNNTCCRWQGALNKSYTFKQTSSCMKIAKKKVNFQTCLVKSIIDLKSMLKKVLKKEGNIAIKCASLVIMTLSHMQLTPTPPTLEQNHLWSGLSGKSKGLIWPWHQYTTSKIRFYYQRND